MGKFIIVNVDKGPRAINTDHIVVVEPWGKGSRVAVEGGSLYVKESFEEVLALINQGTPAPNEKPHGKWVPFKQGGNIEKMRNHIGKEVRFLGADDWEWSKSLTAGKSYELDYYDGSYFITLDSGKMALAIYKEESGGIMELGEHDYQFFLLVEEGYNG